MKFKILKENKLNEEELEDDEELMFSEEEINKRFKEISDNAVEDHFVIKNGKRYLPKYWNPDNE